MNSDELIIIGKVSKPFGIRGEFRILPYTESLEIYDLADNLTIGKTSFKVLSRRFHKGAIIIQVAGIETPEQARTLCGCEVSTTKANLPDKDEDEFFWYELIGLQVHTKDGQHLGFIKEIIPTGANDVFRIEGPLGEILLPYIDDVVLDIDLASGNMLVDPLEGLIPDA